MCHFKRDSQQLKYTLKTILIKDKGATFLTKKKWAIAAALLAAKKILDAPLTPVR